jgi:hypothetical protein
MTRWAAEPGAWTCCKGREGREIVVIFYRPIRRRAINLDKSSGEIRLAKSWL